MGTRRQGASSVVVAALSALLVSLGAACTDQQPSIGAGSDTTPLPPQNGRFVPETLVTLPDFASSMVFTSESRILYAEKGGFGGVRDAAVRIVNDGVLDPQPLIVIRGVETRSEMGLLGITIDPDYETNRWVYVFYTHGPSGFNRLARFRDEGRNLTDSAVNVLRSDFPSDVCGNHQGGNLAFGPDRMLYVTIGDNGCNACNSQSNDTLAGKILRLTRDGNLPADSNTPFFATGLRNSFDIAFHPSTGELFATENGPSNDDEVNRILPGRNYGWPFFQCGVAQGTPCAGTVPANPVPPVRCYSRVIAPTGITIYDGDRYPSAFQGDLFFGDFNQGILHRLVLSPDGSTVESADDEFLTGLGRITDVVSGPDGLLYVLTDGEILRINFVAE